MKNNIKNILFPILVFMAFISFGSTSYASTAPSIYVTPTGITKNVGEVFSASINVNPSSAKVYAVEGTIDFKNLSCDSVLVVDGMMAQTSPTCAKPYFLIGIPNGTDKDTAFLNIKVKGVDVGVANVNIINVDIIGEGKSIGTNSTNGVYTIVNNATKVGSYANGSKNLTGSILTTNSSGSNTISKVSTGSQGSKTINGSKDLNESVESNTQLAFAGMSISGVSINWILLVIILMLLIYIFLRERYYQKNR